MEYNHNEQHASEDEKSARSPLGNIRTPSSFFPVELSRLGLDNGSTPSSSQVNGLIAALDSRDWHVRVAAVRALEKLGERAPLEPLLAALNDDDGSVRAAAVHALGAFRERAPVERLVTALDDRAWHVRETAVLTLGRLGQRAPRERLLAALRDTDGSVREAAQLALQWTKTVHKAEATGVRAMEQETHNERGSQMQEMMQGKEEYGQEQAYEHYFYGDDIPSRGDKITPGPARRSRLPLISLLGLAVLLVFIAGGTVTWIMLWPVKMSVHVVPQVKFPGDSNMPFTTTGYAMFGFNAQHTHFNPGEDTLAPGNVSHLSIFWSAHTGGINTASPVVSNGVVYIGSEDHHLYAFSVKGEPLWTATVGDQIWSTPAVENGVVYTSALDGKLYAFDAMTGTPLWAVPTDGGATTGSPAVETGIVYIGASNSGLEAFQAATGKLLWKEPGANGSQSSPAVAKDIVYMAPLDGTVYAFNAETGKQLWSFSTGTACDFTPVVANGVVYAGSEDGKLYALDATTGAVLWSYGNVAPTCGHASPIVSDGTVYTGLPDGELVAFRTR